MTLEPHILHDEDTNDSEQHRAASFSDVYELCSILRGGFSLAEYLVRHISIGEKFLCVELDYGNIKHFNKELCLARLMSFIGHQHANHLTYREFFADEDARKIQIIMEPYINKCLCDVIDQICRRKLTLSDDAIWGIIAQVFNGLYFYHQTDINGFCGKTPIHGGINAENIYISTNGVVQLGPFRLLPDFEDDFDNLQEDSTVILPTSPGSTVQSSWNVSDLQALGCIVYELLTGISLSRDEQLQYYTPCTVQEARKGLQSEFVSGNLLQFVKLLLDASVSSTAALLSVADNEHLLANIDFAKDVIAARSVHNKDQTVSLRSSVTKNKHTPSPDDPVITIPGGIAYINELIQAAIEPILIEQTHLKDEIQKQKDLIAELRECLTQRTLEMTASKKDISMLQRAVLKLTSGEHREKSGSLRATSNSTRFGTAPRSQTISSRSGTARISSARSPAKTSKSPRATRSSDANSSMSVLTLSGANDTNEKRASLELKKLKTQVATLTRQLSDRDDDILELRRRLENSYQPPTKESKDSPEETESLRASALSATVPCDGSDDDAHYVKFVCLPCNHLIIHRVRENKIHLHSCPKCSGGISNLVVITDD